MSKRVLIAVNPHSDVKAALFYGRQLADRTASSVILIAVAEEQPLTARKANRRTAETHSAEEAPWLDSVLDDCQRGGNSPEVFVANGSFIDEIVRFVQTQPSVQFIVMAFSEKIAGDHGPRFSAGLKGLRRSFAGEILLIEKAGEITRVADVQPYEPKKGGTL